MLVMQLVVYRSEDLLKTPILNLTGSVAGGMHWGSFKVEPIIDDNGDEVHGIAVTSDVRIPQP